MARVDQVVPVTPSATWRRAVRVGQDEGVPTLLDYLDWRGDLPFAERGFTVVDNLVLSAASYVDLRGAVPPDGAPVTITAAAAGVRDAVVPPDDPDADPRRLTVVPRDLLDHLAATIRYANATLAHAVDVVDAAAGMQFAAVTFDLDDGTRYVAFRGTDNTLLGWRENFEMSYTVMAAQKAATEYLAARIAESTGPVHVGGHSKGGNLAVYAAMTQAPAAQDRIATVWSNDGPAVAPGAIDPAGMARIEAKVTTVVPQFSVVGRLFATAPPDHIVASDAADLMQHDLMTWQVRGTDLIEVPALAPAAVLLDDALREWLAQVGPKDRQAVTDALFGALSASGANLFFDVGAHRGSIEPVLRALASSREGARRPLRLAARAAWDALLRVNYGQLIRHRPAGRAAMQIFVGAAFLAVPGLAIEVLASFALLLLTAVLAVVIGRRVAAARARRVAQGRRPLGRGSTAALVAVTVLALWAAARFQPWIPPENLVLTLTFGLAAWSTLRRAAHAWARRRTRALLLWGAGLGCAAVAATAVLTRAVIGEGFIVGAGRFLLAVGLVELFLVLRDQIRTPYTVSEYLRDARLGRR